MTAASGCAGRVRIEEGASLRIDLLRAEDQGWYECRVLFLDRHSTDADFQNGTWIHLTVNAPPTFLETPPAFVEVRDRDPLSLTCTAVGNPQPVVIWKRSDLAVQSGDTVQSGAQVDGNSSLIFRPLVKEQHGLWQCTATNQVASVSATTSVHVLGTSPHAVTNVSVLPLLLAANISWEPGFDGGYFQRFSVWYTPLVKHPPRAHHDWVSLSVPVGAQHLLVENLQPDMSYQFSVLAQNKLGSGPFSQIVTSVPRGFPVTTVPPEPPAMTVRVFLSPPQALTANETVRGVLLRWEPPAQFSVALSGYALELRQDKGGWEVLDRSIPSTKTQVLVPGLIKVGIVTGCSLAAGQGKGFRSPASPLPGAGAAGDAVALQPPGWRLGWPPCQQG
ncbi:protein turtle hypothetical protein [Limosa lapponica baueri]|uniref:Uncharacterized protein n=1 Tax=Limosa lapponica baueri TaxID=1758121 RepID=A0A2I0T5P1_LIMLA|nr:protein turtle hypothetical protein [Limosa lapponica baueri]